MQLFCVVSLIESVYWIRDYSTCHICCGEKDCIWTHWNHTCLLVIMNQTWMGYWTPNLFTVAEHPEMYNTNMFQTGCPAACNRPELCLSIRVNITIPGLWKTHNLEG